MIFVVSPPFGLALVATATAAERTDLTEIILQPHESFS